jgi:hypothetical protein
MLALRAENVTASMPLIAPEPLRAVRTGELKVTHTSPFSPGIYCVCEGRLRIIFAGDPIAGQKPLEEFLDDILGLFLLTLTRYLCRLVINSTRPSETMS